MNLTTVIVAGGILFILAYYIYGRFLSKRFDLNDDHETPATEINDGVDFVPAEKSFLLAQHFSAIAAAGPIVGPILAGIWFGWLPVFLWIVFGAIFFGAVHDFSSLVGSIRHRAKSIVEIVRVYLGRNGYFAFLIFVWFSLIYVITAFTDLTSGSFVDPELGGGVATSSILYLMIGIMMGIALKLRMPLIWASLVFFPLVLLAIWGGRYIPAVIPAMGDYSPRQIWNVILLLYCLIASIVPMWILLQPRGYLGGFFLYGTLAAGLIGLFIGGESVQYPAFLGFTSSKGHPLLPFLFVTVACGACSGFHGIVCSGTTSKQIAKESDCRAVGYGGMLLEGLVALLALATVMILAKGDSLAGATPDRIYAEGLGRFVQHLGIPRDFARSFTLLAFTTFIYDTLDVATRLARYLFQELTGWSGWPGRIFATISSLVIPMFFLTLEMKDAAGHVIPAWRYFWTVFGTSNQLLAALTLMILTVWLAQNRKSIWISFIPMIFMTVMTLWSLFHLMHPLIRGWVEGSSRMHVTGFAALLLFLLAIILIFETAKVFRIILRTSNIQFDEKPPTL